MSGIITNPRDVVTGASAGIGTELDLAPIAIASKELVSAEGIAAMRDLDVTRIFVDPRIDPDTGDVFGTILRIAPTATVV